MDTSQYADRLRESTAKLHTQVEKTDFFSRLITGRFMKSEYVTYLRCFSILHGVLENLIARSEYLVLARIWRDDLRKLSLLEQDLHDLVGNTVTADATAPTRASLKFVAELRQWALHSPARLLGCLYVLEGSTNGAPFICAAVEDTLGLEGGAGVRYLSNYGNDQPAHWHEFKNRLNAVIPTEDIFREVEEGALATFSALKKIAEAFDVQSNALLQVTAINPEAGSHRIPQDPEVLRLARIATENCLNAMPYVKARYGSRGERYAHSDGAWLASLIDLPVKVASRQLDWLSKLLSSLGMPRALLARHLTETDQLLRSARFLSTNDSIYLVYSEHLNKLTARHVPQAQQDKVKEIFARLHPVDRNAASYCDEIIVSTFADERIDNAGAFRNTQNWILHDSPWSNSIKSAAAAAFALLEAECQPVRLN